jgi:transposase
MAAGAEPPCAVGAARRVGRGDVLRSAYPFGGLKTPPPLTPRSLADLDDVRRKLEELLGEGRGEELIEIVLALLADVRDTNTALTVRLRNALRALYGRKSQKISDDQLSLLFAALGQEPPEEAPKEAEDASPPETSPAPDGPVPQPPAPPVPPRGRGGRAPLPKQLPRESKVVPVPEAERVCERCGAPKKCIGYRTSEILEFVPAHFKVIEEKCEKFVCPSCAEEGVVTAPSEKVMDRGRPGPGLLSNILVQKFQDAMPLYRQIQAYERCGVSLSQSTIGDWSSFALDVLAPVAAQIFARVLHALVVQADDTGLRVLDRDHPNGVKRGHVWAFVGDKLVAFRYTPDWKAKRPAALLRDFAGTLQGDGYAGYEAMLRDGEDGAEPVVPLERRLGCGMHIRSKFEKAAKAGDARGAVALFYFKEIYQVEATCKQAQLTAEGRKSRRDAESLPVVERLYKWIREIHPQAVPKTPLYKATYYALGQEALWRRCFTDGRFEIDNGEVERQLRRVALGRKNYLFAGSDTGAERLAVGYTVFGSCHMHGVNPVAWATDVIEKLQGGWPRSRLEELLPDRWVKPSSPPDVETIQATE